ncbi:MAG TPA: PAS domain S-box protein [Kofleriaceae bacterium]|nr:PAS domain S-box protein [Kofleriaceae bacterium]
MKGSVDLGERAHSDEVFRRLLDAAPDAVVVVDEQGRIVLVNRQTESMFGYRRDAIIGREVEILIPERFRTPHTAHRGRFVASPKVRPMGSGLELFGRRRNGTEFPIEISLSPLPTRDGMLVSASIRDISERKQNERKMRRIQEHLLSAVESIQGAFAIFDIEDRLVLCNSSFRHLFGRHVAGEVVGAGFEQLLDAAIDAAVFDLTPRAAAQFRARCLTYHRSPSTAIDVRTAEGQSLRLIERRTAEGGTVMTVWNVTEEVEHEEELRRAQSMAEAASSAKSEFLSSMSHELRTPLNAILGFAQLLQRDRKSPLSDRHRERIDHVLKGGEHLLRLIDEILDLSRIESGRVSVSIEPFALPEVLAEVRTTLDPMALRAEVSLIIAPTPPDLPHVVADRTRFKQILLNYGSNSIKYGRRRGTATFRAEAAGGMVRVRVVDDGIGIPEDKQERVFQPFHRAGQETGPIEGTGIGLAITRRLAELMGGRVGFHSAEGQGSEFWIDIPAHASTEEAGRGQPPAARALGSSLSGADGSRYVVVYIEDNPSNIAFMEDLIADFDRVELVTAPTAEIGIELVRARRPNAVIMDIHLPGMNGFEATRRLREWPETRDIPIVALSAGAMMRDRARLAGAGFYRYLTKPVKVDELAAVLEELLVQPLPG